MNTIELSIDVAAPLATLRAAISTPDGFRRWLAADTRVEDGRYRFGFGPRAVTFALNAADERGVRLTCVAVEDNPDWLHTELTIVLTPAAGGKTRVELAHAGYASKNECYARSVEGWQYFLASLAQYATTGTGMPFDAAPARSIAASTSAEVVS